MADKPENPPAEPSDEALIAGSKRVTAAVLNVAVRAEAALAVALARAEAAEAALAECRAKEKRWWSAILTGTRAIQNRGDTLEEYFADDLTAQEIADARR